MGIKGLAKMKKTPVVVADTDEMLEDTEAEYNYRKKFTDQWVKIIMVISVLFIGYQLITAGFGMPELLKHNAIHLGFLLVLTFLYFPASKGSPRARPSNLDIVLSIISA
ncbi:MAG: hypothetical protein ACYC1A_07715, partial [Spirochaetales bacterium]